LTAASSSASAIATAKSVAARIAPPTNPGYGSIQTAPATVAPAAPTAPVVAGATGTDGFPASWTPQQRMWAQQWQQYYAQQGGGQAQLAAGQAQPKQK